MMNAVIYYSNTGQSQSIAQWAAQRLGYPLLEMRTLQSFTLENLVVVFPVHSQNVPAELKPVFQKLTARQVIVLAAYGKMSHGNVLRECQRRYGWRLVAGAYVPTRHCYLPEDKPFRDYERLDFLEEAFARGRETSIPRSFKNPFANFLIGTRSRLGVRLVKTKMCVQCGQCAMVCGRKKCIRCLKCVQTCPQGALSFRLRFFMALYLKKPKKDELIIYK